MELSIERAGAGGVELMLWTDTGHRLSSRLLNVQQLHAMAMAIEPRYYRACNDAGNDVSPLIQIGRELYQWLDGKESWLTATLSSQDWPVFRMHLSDGSDEARDLAHLPWELLHDGREFIVPKGLLPIRVVKQRDLPPQPTRNRYLRVLFMATSPEGVQPELAYEREEAGILEESRRQPLGLIVEESGSMEGLANTIDSFDHGQFDVLHLTGHGMIENGLPYFVAESETGDPVRAGAKEFRDAIRERWPRVVFLSGCHTAEQLNHGSAYSLAQMLVEQGAQFALGWARPVYDRTGLIAAPVFYKELSSGRTCEEAVRQVHRAMVDHECADWHLLRVLGDSRESLSPVTTLRTRDREQFRYRPPEDEFLDDERRVRVADARRFVGRRRASQRCLRALDLVTGEMGVWLYGLGGNGKSTLAARLLRRMESLFEKPRRVVIYGIAGEDVLRRRLADVFEDRPDVVQTLNDGSASFAGQLQRVLSQTATFGPVFIVLDNFEQNMKGQDQVHGDASALLRSLARALAAVPGAGRLIVTCRYYPEGCLPDELKLHAEPLVAMDGTEARKKALRDFPADANDARLERVLAAAGGNPRLLEWMLARWAGLSDELLDRMIASEQQSFRESIFVDRLLQSLAEPERRAMAQWSLFDLPVPAVVAEKLGLRPDLARPLQGGLVENHVQAGGEPRYRVPSLLGSPLAAMWDAAQWANWRKAAIEALHQACWLDPERQALAMGLEVVRLGMEAGQPEPAVTVAAQIATFYINNSRFQDAHALLLRVIGGLGRDYRLLHSLGCADMVLGDPAPALALFEEARAGCPVGDSRLASKILHQMAGVRRQQGQTERALELYQEALGLEGAIGDVKGRAATLHNIAGVRLQKGQVEQALALYQEVLAIQEGIGDLKGRSATLHNMALLRLQQGQVEHALALNEVALGIQEGIGDVKGKADTLASMAYMAGQAKDGARAEKCFLEAARLLGQVRAFSDLLSMVGNVGAMEGPAKLVRLAQAAWLSARVEAGKEAGFHAAMHLLYELGREHSMAPRLALRAAMCAADSGNAEYRALGPRILLAVAAERKVEETRLNEWLAVEGLDDPARALERLDLELIDFIGNEWVFDPESLGGPANRMKLAAGVA